MRINSSSQALTTGTMETCWGRGPCTTPGITKVWRQTEGRVAQKKEMLQGLFSGLPSICKSLLGCLLSCLSRWAGSSVQPTKARAWWWSASFTLGLCGSPGLPQRPEPCSLSSFCVKRWKRGCPMAQWAKRRSLVVMGSSAHACPCLSGGCGSGTPGPALRGSKGVEITR